MFYEDNVLVACPLEIRSIIGRLPAIVCTRLEDASVLAAHLALRPTEQHIQLRVVLYDALIRDNLLEESACSP